MSNNITTGNNYTMSNNNNNTSSRKLHNPKAHTPAIYIPCWLIQVNVKLISHGAKLLYGRLSQWANTKGKVFRAVHALAEELGVSVSAIERYLKELRDLNLIGTFQPQKGGINHFEFYEHEWMYIDINEHLSYKEDPPSDLTVPPVKCDGTPPSDLTAINIKKIKINKDIKTSIVSLEKKSLSLDFMLENNPHLITIALIQEWMSYRKKPITTRVWNDMNNIMEKLMDDGIYPEKAFETMLSGQWQGMQYRYFENEIAFLKKKNKPDAFRWTAEKVMRA